MSDDLIIGLIMMAIIGPAIGNYATSVVYRLPLGQTPFEKHPYCGSCRTMLTPRDLFPIWSYVFLRGRCRYCAAPIPPIHTVVEVASGVLFIVNYIAFGLSESFLLLTALGVFWIILAALEHQQQRFYPLILTFCFFLAAMGRLMLDGSIYPMIQSGFLMLFISVAIWQIGKPKTQHSAENTGYHIPKWAMMAALAGVALPLKFALCAMALAGVLYGFQRLICKSRLSSAVCGIGVWALLLYTQSSISL